MNGWFNPDNWMDVFDHLLLVLGVVGAAAIPSIFAARSHKEIKSVKDQVVNGNKVPMRFDLDKIVNIVHNTAQEVEKIAIIVTELNSKVKSESEIRRENIRELRTDVERSRGEAREDNRDLRRDIDNKLDRIEHRKDDGNALPWD